MCQMELFMNEQQNHFQINNKQMLPLQYNPLQQQRFIYELQQS